MGKFWDCTDEEYYGDTSRWSYSSITQFCRDPWSWHCGQRQEATAEMDFGNAFHKLIFFPDIFESSYVVKDFDRRTKEGKKTYEDIVASGKKVLDFEEMDLLRSMSRSFDNHPICLNLLESCDRLERAVTWDSVLPMRSKIDGYGADFVFDLKSIQSLDSIPDSILKYGYHAQAAIYLEAMREAGCEKSDFFWIFVEKKKNPQCAVLMADESILEVGRELYLSSARRVKECQESLCYHHPWSEGIRTVSFLTNRVDIE